MRTTTPVIERKIMRNTITPFLVGRVHFTTTKGRSTDDCSHIVFPDEEPIARALL